MIRETGYALNFSKLDPMEIGGYVPLPDFNAGPQRHIFSWVRCKPLGAHVMKVLPYIDSI